MLQPNSDRGVALAGHVLPSRTCCPPAHPCCDLEHAVNRLLSTGSTTGREFAQFIYRELYPFVAAIVTRCVPAIDTDHKESAISVTFQQFFETIDRKKLEARGAKAFIATIARRRAIDEYRKQSARGRTVGLGALDLEEMPSNSATASWYAEYNELVSHIANVVRSFPPRLQQTAMLLLNWSQDRCTPKQLQVLAEQVYGEIWTIDGATAALSKTRSRLEESGVRELLEAASHGMG